MTITKARLYRTAVVSADAVDLPEGFPRGAFVSVEYIGRGAFGLNFRCKTDSQRTDTAVLSENQLERFVL